MTPLQQPDPAIREQRVGSPTSPNLGYFTLKAREKELTDQRQYLEERREELSGQLNEKSGIDLAGVEQRITAIDQRLKQVDNDLGQIGREAVAAAPASMGQPDKEIIYRGNSDGDMVGAGLGGAFLMLMLLSPFLFRSWRRRRKGAQTQTLMPVLGAERIDRMEQSIDSIAVEIERVSENQRFMTRLMTETQLAGTIAAVRGSTEAAKAAAERASHA